MGKKDRLCDIILVIPVNNSNISQFPWALKNNLDDSLMLEKRQMSQSKRLKMDLDFLSLMKSMELIG